MNIYKMVAWLVGVARWAAINPDKAGMLFLYRYCKPLWRYFYRRQVQSEKQQLRADIIPLQRFREMVRSSYGEQGFYVRVEANRAKVLKADDEVMLDLEIMQKGSILLVIWPWDEQGDNQESEMR